MPGLRKVHVLAIQPYDYIRPDSGEGAGSIIRIREAQRLLRLIIPKNALIVLPQGYGKKYPTVKLGRESLGMNIHLYLRTLTEMANLPIVQDEMSWGTKNDILASYQMVAGLGYDLARFHFVSDEDHLRRVKLIWDKTHPKGWTAGFYPASGYRMSVKERRVREPAARLVSNVTLSAGLFFFGRPVAEEFR